jgi:hypothetical protein
MLKKGQQGLVNLVIGQQGLVNVETKGQQGLVNVEKRAARFGKC